ncbi:MAG: hypothetical protein P4K94_06715, partial [Terracidiphilus sp.]|nr:hypothetical protein [Terracidiphilus sp.]
MFPCAGRALNPFSTATALLQVAAALSLVLASAAACAQASDSLPAAPQPQTVQTHASLALPQLAFAPAQAGSDAATSAEGPEPQAAPIVSMFPHPARRFWISGQANIVLQGDLPFHTPYVAANSFAGRGEYKTSLVGTVFTALRPTSSIRYNTDLVLDLESTGGRGLGQAFGLAGFTNLDVVRNPTLSSVPYLARYQVHQVIGLTQETTPQEPGPYALAPSVPVRRLDFRAGKLTLPDF